jgi:glycosyltransferase involved in cell wall biosynthesis
MAVPSFKQEAFLFECLNSLIAQTMPLCEAIVVDCLPDCIISRIVPASDDPRVRYIRHDINLGPDQSKNTGLQPGTAPFPLGVDADNFFHPIDRQGADGAYTDFQLIGDLNSVRKFEPKPTEGLAEEQWVLVRELRCVARLGGRCVHLGFTFARATSASFFSVSRRFDHSQPVRDVRMENVRRHSKDTRGFCPGQTCKNVPHRWPSQRRALVA